MSFVAVDTVLADIGGDIAAAEKEAVYYVGWVVTNGGVIETSFENGIGGISDGALGVRRGDFAFSSIT